MKLHMLTEPESDGQVCRQVWKVIDPRGSIWKVATDGYIIGAVNAQFEHADLPDISVGCSSQTAKMVGLLLARTLPEIAVPVREFLEWAGPPHWEGVPCQVCDERGKVQCARCAGLGRLPVKCGDCSVAHDCFCEWCGGDGRVQCPEHGSDARTVPCPSRIGRFGKVCVDLVRLARGLDAVGLDAESGEVLLLSEPEDPRSEPLIVSSHTWATKVVLMPYRAGADDRVSVWPG